MHTLRKIEYERYLVLPEENREIDLRVRESCKDGKKLKKSKKL